MHPPIVQISLDLTDIGEALETARIAVEDGENGMDELRESVRFLRTKIAEHF